MTQEKEIKDINEWTLSELKAVPFVEKWDMEVTEIDSLIIVPQNHIHDSGFRCMSFVCIKKGEPVCQVSGCSDVVHLDGIGGYGKNWLKEYGSLPSKVNPTGWSIDCLRKSKCLRLFSHGKLTAGRALSSFELFSEKEQ